MSKLIIIAADMHKIAEFSMNVKYRRPGNVVEYIPVEFEVFKDGDYYKAIPLPCFEAKTLANLSCEYTFQIKNGKPYNCRKGTEEIVDNIVRKMALMSVVEVPWKGLRKGNK